MPQGQELQGARRAALVAGTVGNKVEFGSSSASPPRFDFSPAQPPSCLGRLGAQLQPLPTRWREKETQLVFLWHCCRRPEGLPLEKKLHRRGVCRAAGLRGWPPP